MCLWDEAVLSIDKMNAICKDIILVQKSHDAFITGYDQMSSKEEKYFDYKLTKYNKYGNGTITIRYFSYTQSCSDSSIKMCKLCVKLKKEQAE